jgi:hypothetical protein
MNSRRPGRASHRNGIKSAAGAGRLWRAYDEAKRTPSNSYAPLRIFPSADGRPRAREIDMIRLSLTKDRLFDLTLDRAQDRAHGPSQIRWNARWGGYRFGRISGNSVRFQARRVADGAEALFGAVLRIIAAAKLRRIEREFRIHGPRHDWLRIDDDHFTEVDR